MVEVFKTNVQTKQKASKILAHLSIQYPTAKIDFDLDDCDKILRVEARNIFSDKIIKQLNQANFKCEVLK